MAFIPPPSQPEQEKRSEEEEEEHLLLLEVSESCDVIGGIRGHAGDHPGAWGRGHTQDTLILHRLSFTMYSASVFSALLQKHREGPATRPSRNISTAPVGSGTFHKFGRRPEERRCERAVEGEGVCWVQVPTLVLLDGQHGQSVDGLVGGERSTQGTAQEVLEEEKTIYTVSQ